MDPADAPPAEDIRDDVTLRTLSALGAGATDVPTGANFNDLLRAASRHCRRLVHCESARIWVVRRGGRRLVARDFNDDGDQKGKERRLARGEGLAGWAIENERSLRLSEGEPLPPLHGKVPAFKSALVIPLFRRGTVFAAIECLNKLGEDGFTDADFDRLDVASEHVAFALDNALLYAETERRALEKEVLLEISRALATPLDLDEVIEAIFKSLRQVVTYDAAAIYLVNRSTQALELVSEVGYPEGSDEAFGLQVGQGIVGWVAKTGQPLIVPDVKQDARYVAARAGTRSELAAPLLVEGRTLGVFNLESDLDDAYHEGHLELVSAFAAQAAVTIERARLTRELLDRRRIEKELAIAREIQLSFLPKAAPDIAGFEVAGSAQPHDEVGGDYFDFIPISESRLGIAIADVSGKGIPAALIMAGFRMSLLAEIRNEFAIRAVMRKVNSLLYESTDRDKFVTAFYGVLDFHNRVLIFSNAGHNPPILRREGGRFDYLTDGGVALGVLPDAQYEERPIAIRPGDVLVLYTDGVTEAEDTSNAQFGRKRLEACMTRLAHLGAREIVAGIIEEVRAFAGARGPTDDLTLMVLKARPEEPAATTGAAGAGAR
ncbi:MAG TPA: SpoIIE family protein phosphatase [Candidatus Udaeobacter sp.]|jgi:serine phosphatase RsbU (regulator of sigma subunit)|nr:SpoIIE family protein phosphatase [Candidatus Udaeobacter sp.]